MNQKKRYSYPQINLKVNAEMKDLIEKMASLHDVSSSSLIRGMVYYFLKTVRYHDRQKALSQYLGGPGLKSEIELETPEEKAKREERRAARRKAIGANA